jgi:uncharacterized membrane protein YhaH (DUF805 family)
MSDVDPLPLEPLTSDDVDPEIVPDENEQKKKVKKCKRLFGFNKIMLGWILLVFLIVVILTTVLLTLNTYTQDGSKDWVLVGGITSSSATFRIRTDSDSQARTFIVTQNSQVLQGFNISFSTLVASIDVQNLSPNTAYDYQTLGEENQVVNRGNFHTAAPEGTRMNFTIATAGCSWTGSTSDVFSKIAATKPLLFFHLGDFHYEDINVDNVETRVQAIDKVLQSKPQAQLFSSTALAYIWDDHDYLGNDSEGEGAGRQAALESYRIAFPFYEPLPASLNSTSKEVSPYHAFTIGTVRFVISDLRSESNADSIYSQEQKTWLYNEIANSTEYDFVVWITSKPWIGPDGGDDAWWGKPNDRAELSQHIVQTVTKQNFIALSADAHMIGFDDGRNTYYGISPSNVSFPILQSGPLDRLGSDKGGPFSEGCFTTKYERNSQHSTIQFQMASDTSEEACLIIKTDFFEKKLCGNIFGSTASAGTGSCSASMLSGGSIALLSISGILLVVSMVALCSFLERLEAVRVSAILICSFFIPLIAGFGIPLAMGVSQYDTFTILLISFLQMLVTSMFISVWARRSKTKSDSAKPSRCCWFLYVFST